MVPHACWRPTRLRCARPAGRCPSFCLCFCWLHRDLTHTMHAYASGPLCNSISYVCCTEPSCRRQQCRLEQVDDPSWWHCASARRRQQLAPWPRRQHHAQQAGSQGASLSSAAVLSSPVIPRCPVAPVAFLVHARHCCIRIDAHLFSTALLALSARAQKNCVACIVVREVAEADARVGRSIRLTSSSSSSADQCRSDGPRLDCVLQRVEERR